jgi:hypothetical protein
MAGARTTFSKRQKEQSRLEKRREKEERKRQRASEKQTQDPGAQASNSTDLLDDELREAALEQQRLFGEDRRDQ